jgi:hypothetical protein
LALEAISALENKSLAEALRSSFISCKTDLEKAEACFSRLTSKAWPRQSLEEFFHSWRDTHLTMTSVAAMMTRLLELSEAASTSDSREAYRKAALNISQVMAEDLGLKGGEDHSELFVRMANTICGGPEWESRRNRVPSCTNFRAWVYQQRVSAPDLAGGLMLSVASEIYNHAEMTYLNQVVPGWLEKYYGFTRVDAKRANTYVDVHAHGVETDHFGVAFSAVEYIYLAEGKGVDYDKINSRCTDYLVAVGRAFEGVSLKVF